MTSILLTRPTGGPAEGLEDYRSRGGYRGLENARRQGAAAVLDTVEASGLRGRGGAAFPAAIKWRLAAQSESDVKFVVANGGEHEPGSDKDKVLLEQHPHSVLEGVAILAFATGASKAWIYMIEDMHRPIASVEHALDEARSAGLLDGLDVLVHRAPTTYVAGEESAAIDSIEGGPGKPRAKPPYPGESGVDGKPTTVNNVETLAHAAWIMREGALAFRAIGTDQSPGTMLFTLSSQLRNPGVYELPFGTTWRELIEGVGGGTRSGRPIRAVHPALSCGFLGAEHLDVAIAHETLGPLGTSPGCGGVRIVEEGEDVLPRLLEIARFFMAEQCGQCPPCRMETNQIVHVLDGVAAGKGPGYAEQIRKVVGFARGKGHCSLIEMAAASIVSSLDLFAEDLARAAGSGS